MNLKKAKENLQLNVIIIDKIPYYLSWIFILGLIVLMTFKFLIHTENFFLSFLSFPTLLLLLFAFFVLNRVTSPKGFKNDKIAFGLIIFFAIMNTTWLIETALRNIEFGIFNESDLAVFRFNYFIIFLALITLILNPHIFSRKIKTVIFKFKDPHVIIFLALSFLTLCPFFLIFQADTIAERTATVAFLLLVFGIFLQFIQYLITQKKK